MRQISPRSAPRRPRARHRSPAAAADALRRILRIQAAFAPRLALAHEDHPVMQPERPLLPELDPFRPHAIARPVFRPRHALLAGVSVAEFRETRFEHGAAFERARLFRGPGADLAV